MPLRKLLNQRTSPKTTSNRAFIYQPLTVATEIRVLEVSHNDTSGGKTRTPILSLKHIDLAAPCNYVAISYMWDSPMKTEGIMVDGRVLPVSPRQRDMISDLGDKSHLICLWIDAICINQDETSERNHQVKLMGDIYSRANYVIAYLRNSDHSSYWSAYKSGAKLSSLNLHSALDNIRNAITLGNLGTLPTDAKYARFVDNNYFVRRWIIQEVCLARSVIIRCDKYELSMDLLGRLFTTVGANDSFTQSRAANICNLRQNRLAGESTTLEDLLYNHHDAGCADRRDRVYALLSLSELAKKHIPVDYDIAPLELLLSVIYVSSCYEHLKESRILSFACFLRQNLLVSLREFQVGMWGPPLQNEESDSHRLLASLRVLCVIRSTRIDADVEDSLNRLRPCLPSLRQYGGIELRRLLLPNGATARQTRGTYEIVHLDDHRVDNGTKVSANNLWTFSFTRLVHDGTARDDGDSVSAGVSTIALDLKDEVWQFPRTLVALVARPTRTGYMLVGRALILSSAFWKITKLAERGMLVEDMLEIVKDHSDDVVLPNTRTMALFTGDLPRLMKWVDVFADE